MNAKEIDELLKNLSINDLQTELSKYKDDDRSSVKKLVEKYEKQIAKYEKELQRIEEMKLYEREYEHLGYVCGIDEVGRGPLAGPVVACAVILPKDADILYVNDSKKLSEKKREELYEEIMDKAIAVGVGIEDHNVIDELNILQATYSAMRKAINNLAIKPDVLLNDAVTIPGVDIMQVPIIKGDAKSVSIAAASIIAKVTRDRMMVELEKKYPGYDFASNKGYGSASHIEGIKKQGLCEIHRRSFTKNFI